MRVPSASAISVGAISVEKCSSRRKVLNYEAQNFISEFDATVDKALFDLKNQLLDAHKQAFQRAFGQTSLEQRDFNSDFPCANPSAKSAGSAASVNKSIHTTDFNPSSANVSHAGTTVRRLVTKVQSAVKSSRVPQMKTLLSSKQVMVNRGLLKQRLQLEHNLVLGSCNIVQWLICFLPIFISFQILEPASNIGSVHNMLIDHYGLRTGQLKALKEWDDVYKFMESFTKQNDLFDPTGKIYWCDPRFLDTLGVTSAGRAEFARQKQLQSQVESTSPSASPPNASGGRRLDDNSAGDDQPFGRRLSSGCSCPVTRGGSSLEDFLLSLQNVYQNPTPLGMDYHGHQRFLYDCKVPAPGDLIDWHNRLVVARGSTSNNTPNGTVLFGPTSDYGKYFKQFQQNYEAYLNNQYLNVSHPSTAKYLPRYHYPYTVLSLLNPVIYQERMRLKECKRDTFAEHYMNQGSNLFSPIFGQNAAKEVDIIECVDWNEKFDEELAEDIDTERYMFMNKNIYARIAGQSGDHTGASFNDWQRIGWLGQQTKNVVISVLLYTSGLEMFTSLSVHISQEIGGSIQVRRSIVSICELADLELELSFHIACLSAVFLSLACIAWDFKHLHYIRKRQIRIGGRSIYSIFSKASLLLYVIVAEVSYLNRENMKHNFDDALGTFLYRKDFSHTGQHNALQHFFEVKEHVHAADVVHIKIKVVGWIVYMLQIIQLVFYLGAHPRVDLLCQTMTRICNGLAHYIVVFAVIFVLLGSYGHWMFASPLPHLFGSMSDTLMKQCEMLVGYSDAWPWDDLEMMTDVEFVLFVLYLLTYFSVVFLVLLNFFVAIILEGFLAVWKKLTEENSGGAGTWIPIDLWHSWRGSCIHRRSQWPGRGAILHQIENLETLENKEKVLRWHRLEKASLQIVLLSEACLCQDFGFADESNALEFLCDYALRAPEILELTPQKVARPNPTQEACARPNPIQEACARRHVDGGHSQSAIACPTIYGNATSACVSNKGRDVSGNDVPRDAKKVTDCGVTANMTLI